MIKAMVKAMVNGPILVGRFGAPHGLGGELRLNSFTGDPQAIAAYKPLLDASGARQFSIVSLRLLKDNVFLAKIAGVAAALTNAGLYVLREALTSAREEEFYAADLIGLAALTEAGEAFGKVVDVLNFGGGDILEIARAGGGETLLWPFRREIFPRVDLESGHLTVVPPLEVEAEPLSPKD
jgi:16S rRNA processing protein RimM